MAPYLLKNKTRLARSRGFGIIEAIISMGIASVLLLAFLSLVITAAKAARIYSQELKASLYLAEAVEAAKDVEQSTDWSATDLDTVFAACAPDCHPEISASFTWDFAAGGETLEDVFTRSVAIEDVFRDDPSAYPNNIVETGGTEDPNTKKVIATVSWYDGINNRSMNLETYVYSN